MKGLSLIQPFATLIAVGQKKIETRNWSTSYRDLVAIHASKKDEMDIVDAEPLRSACLAAGLESYENAGQRWVWKDRVPFGAIVAVAEIAAIFRTTESTTYDWWECSGHWEVHLGGLEMYFGDFSPGRYGWILSDVVPMPEPIPCRGAPGLWDVAPEVEAQIRKAALL